MQQKKDYIDDINDKKVGILMANQMLNDIINKIINEHEIKKEKKAAIGGEGNGGIIYPKLHYGRDALVGIALFLSHLATSGKKCSELRKTYPDYFMAKKKLELPTGMNADDILTGMRERYSSYEINTIDGVKIDFSQPAASMHSKEGSSKA